MGITSFLGDINAIPTLDPRIHHDPSKYIFLGSKTPEKGASTILLCSKEGCKRSSFACFVVSSKVHSS